MPDYKILIPNKKITVSIQNLRKSFGENEVLKGISLEAKEGDVIAILGSSGSGKSTLLRCINMLEAPSAGEINICGEAIILKKGPYGLEAANRKQIERLRSRVAMVFQNYNLWTHRTIIENIIEAPVHVQRRSKADCIAEAEALLEKVGLTDKRDAYPDNLSGGQQQRAAIARALAIRPSVLLFDEPTSALDPELTNEVMKVIREIAKEGRTMLVVTHEMSFARNVSNRVVFLHQGEIEEDGTPEEVFGAPKSERFKQFIRGTHSSLSQEFCPPKS